MYALSLLLCVSLISTELVVISDNQELNQEPISSITDLILSDEKIITENAADLQQDSSIIITNAIEPSMLEYKHWTGTYSPELFTLIINDTQVLQGETYTLKSGDVPLVVQ